MEVKKMVDKVGAVLVVGGGIGGIQSALDLADSGFKVYLLDRNPSIGGAMAQLDKTFPTNDCSMCIMAPKMVDVARHPNIELITYSDLMKVDGTEGKFKVKILKKARSVDEEKCTGCGVCTENCPVMLQIQVPEKPQKALPVRDEKLINEFIQKHSDKKGPLIQILLEINNHFKYVPRDVIEYLSFKLEIPLSNIYRVATFYKSLSLELRGKYHVKVCLGTACHVRGARKIVDSIRDYITQTEEGLFSLETVNCLGACALGPIMVVNEEVHGNMTIAKIDEVLTKMKEAK